MTGAPAGFRFLAEAIGEEAAAALCLEWGGVRIYLPKRVRGSRLAGLVGEEAARRIVDAAPHVTLEIPQSNRALSDILRQAGWSQERRARRLRVSRRTIQRWDGGDAPAFPVFDLWDAS